MVFFVLLPRAFCRKNTARGWLSYRHARLQINTLKSRLINTGLSAIVAFYAGYAGADILPTNIADTQVNTVNAVPVVDIARPSSSGVSKNQFNDFDVNNAGVVINNSLVDGTSSLAGDLGANANFSNKSARIILNEVINTNTSDINGMTEIFGDDASYILSNPNGISCNGCGFTRTPTALGDSSNSLSEVMLTTGTATVENGKTPLTITVDSNSPTSIVIGPGGLDASQVDVTSLFTRKAQIQGIIKAANQLRLLAGTGTLEIENNVAPEDRTLVTTQSDDGAVSIAIDATVAGAMNAGQIFIQATENGVGVTLDTDLISTSGDIEITAEGEIRYKNANASGDITVSNYSAGSDIVASGDSVAAADITWNLSGDGLLDASGDIAISAGGTIEFNCSDPICQIVSEDNIQFDASTLQTNATLVTNTGSDLTINAGVLSASDIRSGNDLHIRAFAGDISAAEMSALNNINLQTDQTDARIETSGITATNGNVIWRLNGSGQLASTGALTAGGNMQFECLPPSLCEISGSTSLTLNAWQLVTQVDIQSGTGRDITINANLDTDARISSGGRLLINAKDGDINTRGLLQAAQDIELRSAADRQLILDGGVISGGDFSIFGDGTYIHDSIGLFDIGGEWVIDTFGLTNNATLTVTEFKDRTFFVNELNNNGLIQSNSSLELHVDELLNNSGVITSLEGVIQIKHNQAGQLTSVVNNSGIISSTNLSQNQQPDSSLIIDPQSLIDAHVAAILNGEQLSAQDLSNSIDDANQRAIADLTVDTNILGAVEIHAQMLNNDSNGSISGSQIFLDVEQLLNSGGLIVVGNNLSISGDSIINQNNDSRFGIIAAHDNIDINLTSQLTNTGIIEATDVQIDAPTQVNDSSGFVVDPLTGQTLDSIDFVEIIGQLAWFSPASNAGPFYQTIQVEGTNSLITSDLSLLTDTFLSGVGADLVGVPIVGDDVYLAELIAHTIRDSGGLPFVTEDRSNLLQLGTLYGNTRDFMAQTGLAFGDIPTSQQLQQLEAPIVVFNQQTLANNKHVYTPRLIMPQAGLNNNQLQAQQLFTQIIAYNQLLMRGEHVTNSASLVGGNRLIIEAIDLTHSTTERNWYVDADGKVQYLSARIESPELVLSLSGDYVQEGGQIVSQGHVYIEAQTVEVSGAEVNGRSVTAEISTEDELIILALERASYGSDVSLATGDQVTLQAGDELQFDGRLKAAGDISLMAKQINLTAADIYTTSETANLTVLARTGSIRINDSYLRTDGDITFQAAQNIGLIRSSLEASRHAENENSGRLFLVSENGDITNDLGRLIGEESVYMMAGKDIVNRSRVDSSQIATIRAGGGGVTQIAGNDLKNLGSEIRSEGDIFQRAEGNILNQTQAQTLVKQQPASSVKLVRKSRLSLKNKITPKPQTEYELAVQMASVSAAGSIYSNAGEDFVNEGNLKADGNIAIAARDIINTRLMHELKDSTSIKTVPGTNKKSITVTSGRQQILDTGKIDAEGDILLNAERDITDTAGRYLAGGDINLLANRDINQNALSWQESEKLSETYTVKKQRGKSGKEYTYTYRYDIGHNEINKAETGSLNAFGSVNIQADQDVDLLGSEIEAGSNIVLSGRDIALQSIQTGDNKYQNIGRTVTQSKTVRHQVAELDAGGSIAIQAEGDLTTYGSQLNAGDDENGNIFINAKGETQLLGVNNEDYSFYQHTKKKSFGRRKTWISEDREVSLAETALSGGGSLLVNLGAETDGDLAGLESGKVLLEGSTVNMGGDAMLYSADSLNIVSGVEYEFHRKEVHKRGAFGIKASGKVSNEEIQRLGHAEINTSGDTVLLSAGDINVVAGRLSAENIIAESGFGVEDEVARTTSINILGDEEALATFEHQYKRGLKFSIDDNFLTLAEEKHNKNWEVDNNYKGSVLNARDEIRLQTQGNIEIFGSELGAGGDLALTANDISILAARDYYLDKEEETISRIGIEVKSNENSIDAFAGLETISVTDEYTRDAVHGSIVSAGNRIDIEASGRLLQRSGELVAGSNVFLRAGEDIDVEAEHTIETYKYEETTTRTGVSSGLSHNYASTKASVENIGQGDNGISDVSNALQAIDAVDSFVSGPSVSGFAGVTTTTTRTQDVVSTAQNASIISGGNIQFSADNSIGLTGTWVSAENNINLSANDIVIRAAENVAIQANDFRTTSVGLNLQASKNSGSVGFGGNFTDQDIDSISGTVQASMLRSGADISLNAIQDITITGSDIETGENLDLIAGRDVYLGAQSSSSDYQLEGRSGGAEFGVGYSSTSIGLYGSANVGKEDMLRRGTTYQNSEIIVGRRLTIRSGEDTTLEGVIAEANNVDLQIDGDLTLASLQDMGNADGNRYDAKLRVIGGAGFSASGSVGEGSTEGTITWVSQQTRLIGHDSVSATVAGHTQLDGAVLAADNGNLLLDTNTLGYSDVYDLEQESTDYLNIGFSISGEQGNNPNQQQNNQSTNLPLASGQQSDGSGGFGLTISGYSSELDRAQINLATLGEGNIRVRQDELTGNDSLANINRDVSIAQQVTRDNSEDTNFYISDSSIRSLGNMFLFADDADDPSKKNTFSRWTDDMGDYARSLYLSYRTMDKLGEIKKSDSDVINAFSKAASVHIDTVDLLGSATLGLFPGTENNGGFYGETPALFLGDQFFIRVQAVLKDDKEGKLYLDKSTMKKLGEVERPDDNDFVFINGVQNNFEDAIRNGGMQTGAVEFIVAYNPEHGFLGDGLEYGWDKLLGGIMMSGNARQLRNFFQEGIDEKISFSIAAHSQGALLTYRAMYGLDFRRDKKLSSGSLLFSGAPVDELDFYSVARDAGFKVSDKLKDTKVIFQVNRPKNKTSLFGRRLVDPVSDMSFLLGGNGNNIDSLFSLYTLTGEDSPHSNYLCQGVACAIEGKQTRLESSRKHYYEPDINLPTANFKKPSPIKNIK